MAPLKFEEYSKEKLNQRRLTPSPQAWERLATTLGSKEKSQKRSFVWYGIAAVFVGLLVLSLINYSGALEVTKKDTLKVVEKESNVFETQDKSSEVLQEPVVVVVEEIEEKSITNHTGQMEQPDIQTLKNETPVIVAYKDSSMPKIIKDNVDSKLKTDGIIEEKITAVIAQVALLESQNVLATDKEVDSLLREAQKEILVSKIVSEDGVVDASALLLEAEQELDRSFRDQIFDALKSGYLKAKTAVANRNN